jgi:hypothetical protein
MAKAPTKPQALPARRYGTRATNADAHPGVVDIDPKKTRRPSAVVQAEREATTERKEKEHAEQEANRAKLAALEGASKSAEAERSRTAARPSARKQSKGDTAKTSAVKKSNAARPGAPATRTALIQSVTSPSPATSTSSLPAVVEDVVDTGEKVFDVDELMERCALEYLFA